MKSSSSCHSDDHGEEESRKVSCSVILCPSARFFALLKMTRMRCLFFHQNLFVRFQKSLCLIELLQACNGIIAFVWFDVRLDEVGRQATRRLVIGSSALRGRLLATPWQVPFFSLPFFSWGVSNCVQMIDSVVDGDRHPRWGVSVINVCYLLPTPYIGGVGR